jgi:hypothetical protein
MQRAATPGLTAALLMAATAAPEPAATPNMAAADEAAASGLQQQQGEVSGISYTPAVEALLMPYFLEFCQQQYK